MLLKETFAKDIYRSIDPVVKANELGHLKGELEEFVITNEAKLHLQRFFDEYNDPDAVGNGAWISGFFGSGKSHLLKIMAVVMENREVDGKGALEYILPKLTETPALAAAMEQAYVRHPSESVLFNIDSFAPNAGRSEAGAILSAFIKAFNHHCGYFDGDQQHIAKLEYDLDQEGHLTLFKERVAELCGKPWEQVRSSSLLFGKKITQAFDEVCGNPEGTTTNVISYYQQTYKPDIRMFAQSVAAYIAQHKKGFRLNFFVDEVGQFIAQNTTLMVNLQTIAEELDNFCKGNSWVIVTSQENVEDVVGQMKQTSANDFSKIKDRFKIRMTLTSSDAKEVIRDRLLAKKHEDEPAFEEVYNKYKADFKVLFDFADGAKTYKQYQNAQEFCDTYPFVPYQFEIFMTALRGLSDHNCFTGRHNSTGARSMLGVFQLVAQHICDDGANTYEGTLAPFDMMFEGLRNDLKSEVYAAISTAEDQLDDKTAIRLLKVLLLVKYCEDFRATPANLRVLLYGAFTQSTGELNEKIESALNLLENQVYIRRNGANIYEYLTNEEKEVEKEIKNTIVSETETKNLIATMFRDICGISKVTYRNGTFEHSYSYNLRIDGEAQGIQKNDLTVDIITDQTDNNLFGEKITVTPKTLAILLQNCEEFLLGVRTHIQTDRYANLKSGGGEVRAAIIKDKQIANRLLYKQLVDNLRSLLSDAHYNAAGVDITGKVTGVAEAAVESAAQELVRRSYTGLQQISIKFSENEVFSQCLTAKLDDALPEYCQTVLSRLQLMKGYVVTTIAGEGTGSLTSYFMKNEYGWPEIAVRLAVAILYASNKIEVHKNGSPVEGLELAEALKRKRDLEKLVVSVVEEISPEIITQLIQAFRDFAGTNPKGHDQKTIAQELAYVAASHVSGFGQSKGTARQYPFDEEYRDALASLTECSNLSKDWKWVLYQFPLKVEDYAAALEDLQKMQTFINGSPMSKRWSELKQFLESESAGLKELGISNELLEDISAVVHDPFCYKSGQIPRASKEMEELTIAANNKRAELRALVKTTLDEYRAMYEQTYDLTALPQDKRDAFNAIFSSADSELAAEKTPHKIHTFFDRFKNNNAAILLALVQPEPPKPPESSKPPVILPESPVDDGDPDYQTPKPPVTPPPYISKTVSVSTIKSGYGKPSITTEEDVNQYLNGLKKAMINVLSNGDIIAS